MMVKLIETSEESPSQLVAEHIASLLNPLSPIPESSEVAADQARSPESQLFLDQTTALVADDKTAYFISSIIPHLDLVFSKSTAQEAACVSSILVHSLLKLPDSAIPAAAISLAQAFAAKVDERGEERLSALFSLHEVTHIPEVQLAMILSAASYAAQSSKLASSLSTLARVNVRTVDAWITQWALNDKQARDLFLSLADLVKASQEKNSSIEYLRLIVGALKLVQEGDAAAIASLKPHAVAAVAEITRNQSFYQSDIMELPAVKNLATDPTHAPLFNLMSTMLSGDISAFRTAATPSALEQAGCSFDAALLKARMSTLLSLGVKAGQEDVTFEQIQTALDIPKEQVEMFLIRAVGLKLLEGKIDQVKGTVAINRCTMRTFGHKDWVGMRVKIGAWRDQLVAVQASLAANKGGGSDVQGTPSVKSQPAIKV